MLAAAARRQRLRADQALLRDLASEIEWAKVSNVGPDDYARVAPARGRSVASLDADTVARVFAAYEEVKRGQGRMDMEDVLLLTAGMLADEERVAAQVRRQYKWFVVDEFQDVSPIQSALLDLWLGGRDELCVVGDPAQTIYSFAGANASYLRDFPARFPGATTVELVRNYRSTPEVVAAANAVLAGAAEPRRGAACPAAGRSGGALRRAPDEVAEADGGGGDRIAGAPPGTPAGRDRGALPDQRPVRGLRGGPRRPRHPLRRPRRRPLLRAARGAAGGHPAARRLGPDRPDELPELVRGDPDRHGLGARGAGHPRPDPRPVGVAPGAGRWPTSSRAVLATRSSPTSTAAPPSSTPGRRGVTLATLHSAKGLEWDAVFLAGMHDGVMPAQPRHHPGRDRGGASAPLRRDDPRPRPARALSWAAARQPGGRASRHRRGSSTPSCATRPAPSPTTPRHRRAAHCRECGDRCRARREEAQRCDDCPASYDEELFERLRVWRKERADEDSVPAFVVFTDATLQLIAEQKPSSPADLLRISGVGPAKLERYGASLLEVVG